MPYTIFIIKAWAICLLFTLLPVQVSASTQIFASTLEASRWHVESTSNTCTLSHDIPRLGVVRFEQQSNKRLKFAMYVEQAPLKELQARLLSRPPAWKPATQTKDLGTVKITKGKKPLVLPRDMTMRIYSELEQGMEPALAFDDWIDGQDDVVVSFSPVRFREVLANFTVCTSKLPFLDFDPVFEQFIHFSTGSADLSRYTRSKLNKAVTAFRKNRKLKFVLGGHADERGTDGYNMGLSKRRAASVARYLKFKGVPAGKIERRYFGETQPLMPESNETAWSKNRRVAIWLADKSQ